MKILIASFLLLIATGAYSQTWVDSVDCYGREVFMPAEKYKWDWGQATMLHSIIQMYNSKPVANKQIYLDYVKVAMDRTYKVANGLHPNAIASGIGMAFLARVTRDSMYLAKANSIFADYLVVPRTKEGGISHRTETIEMWDDTVYMISMFLLEMYRTTGDEKYLAEFTAQYKLHKQKLADPKWGLWVHGYDDDKDDYPDRCCQKNWAQLSDKRTNIEFWGRGNGWIVMAIADAINTVPSKSKYYQYFAKELKSITRNLPKLQDKQTGLWRQLPIYTTDSLNFLESSATAMFAYGIAIGVKQKVLNSKIFVPVVKKAFNGLKAYATKNEGKYIIPQLVCEGTCIGDKNYYYGRKTKEGVNYAIGAYVMLGIQFDNLK